MIPPVTNFLGAVGMIIIAYGITKHHLFNIKLLISELLVFSIWIFVIARTALSNNYQEFWINGILALLVFVAGILLMRSVSREIEMDKKLLEESHKNLDFEQRLRKTYAEIAEKEIKSKYFR
jgi:Ca2+/Na+ antiporter